MTLEYKQKLKEVTQRNATKLNTFFHYMGHDLSSQDLLHIFRKFRTQLNKNKKECDEFELSVYLFQIAANHLTQLEKRRSVTFFLDKNHFSKTHLERHSDKNKFSLDKLDLTLRAPLIFKDILGFDDELTAKILHLRWGVYRHRLNRARLDVMEYERTKLEPLHLQVNKHE